MYVMLKFHRTIGTYDKINYIVLTEFNKKKLSNLVKDENKIYVKPNFVEKRERSERNLEDYFVYIGRLDAIKGINFLIEAWKEVNEDIDLYVIGTGSEEENLKRFIEYYNIKNIKMLGFMSQNEAFRIIAKSRAVIVPSICMESFGMSIIEGFSLGVPAIGSRLGNIEFIIDNEKNGLLFKINNKYELKSTIESIFYNRELNEELGKNAYQTFFDYYTDEVNYKKLQIIYKNINI